MNAHMVMQLIARADRVAHMSTEELCAFNKDVQSALISGAYSQDQRSLLLGAYAKSTSSINEIQKAQADQARQQKEQRQQEERQTFDSRAHFTKVKEECTAELKKQGITPDQKEDLQKKLSIASNVLAGWEKNDAERNKRASTDQLPVES